MHDLVALHSIKKKQGRLIFWLYNIGLAIYAKIDVINDACHPSEH